MAAALMPAVIAMLIMSGQISRMILPALVPIWLTPLESDKLFFYLYGIYILISRRSSS